MSVPILTTKLFTPPPRPNAVLRPRLIEKLTDGLPRKLTLISAPAGFGKTSLATQWLDQFTLSDSLTAFSTSFRSTLDDSSQIANHPSKTAISPVWLSLDEQDNDATRFFSYLVAAMQTAVSSLGKTALAMFQSPQPPPVELALTPLLNELNQLANPMVLVLDDYHLISAPEIDTLLTFLLAHLPPQLHLVIITREDPNLPLARLRARNQLTEVRAADLRFSVAETAVFLNGVMRLSLTPANIATLEARTEGWIAGLQMASLALQNSTQSEAFITAFSGSHRFVLDYLLEEVLLQQPEEVRTFLLQTSLLERLNGELCDAVTGQKNGRQMLQQLEANNLFLIPLDDQRHWYRYHHLFANVLRLRAAEKQPKQVEQIHQQASSWFEASGFVLEAFQHAAAAHDLDRAERLINADGFPLYFDGVHAPIMSWIEGLPTAVLQERPSLWVTWAGAKTVSGQGLVPEIEAKLCLAEQLLQQKPPHAKHQRLAGKIAAIRAMLSIPNNNMANMFAQADRALALLGQSDLAFRATVTMSIGYAYGLQGELAASKKAYQALIADAQALGGITFSSAGYIGLGNIQEAENRLHQAQESYLRVVELCGETPPPFVGAAYMGLTQISYEWNNLEAAERFAEQGIHFGKQLPSVDVDSACQILLARLRLATADFSAAASLLDQATNGIKQRIPNHHPPELAEVRCQLLLRQGHLQKAIALAEEANHLPSQVRLLLAQGEAAAALPLVKRLREQTAEKPLDLIRAMVLETAVLHANQQTEQAVSLLGKAVKLAMSSQLVRTFVDEGSAIGVLLQQLTTNGTAFSLDESHMGYCQQLLAQFENAKADQKRPFSPPSSPSIDSLTPRELQVLRLIADGLSNREIGQRLHLALDTVKGHNRRIFGKLQVQRRTEAVARARELNLL